MIVYSGEIERQMVDHFKLSKDIYDAYQRVLVEFDEPSIIIADLLRKYDEDDNQSNA